jgi:membrane protein implicated in regulation of membrane protease activity
VGIIYLAALIVGFGTIALQLFMAGDHGAGGDADMHGGDVDADADGDGDHATGHGDGGFAPIFLSLRFWTFTLLAFGLSGTLIHYLDLASSMVALPVALALGIGSGLLATFTFRLLSRDEANSGVTERDMVGQVGKVLVPVAKNRHGKIRIEVKGQTLDLIASTDDEQLDSGQMVLIEDVRDTRAHVSRAPIELLPPKRE